MSNKIEGLLSAKGEFGWAVFLLVVLPALPLGVEWLLNGFSLEPTTVFLTATMYIVGHVFTSNKFWVLLSGAFAAAVLLFSFGHETAAKAAAKAAKNQAAQTGNANVNTTIVDNIFMDTMYYLAFALMAFYAYQHVRLLIIKHMVELEPFFVFDKVKAE